MNHFKIEWSLSLLSKYAAIILSQFLNDERISKTLMLFVIHIKHRPGIHQDQLAEMFKMNRSSVTRGVDQLEQYGFVDKQLDVCNKKANKLYLTASGDALYVDLFDALMKWIDVITEGMTEEEKQLSVKLLTRMAGNACRYVGDDHLANLL